MVTVRSSNRIYGKANPSFGYAIKGLVNGDTVTVTPQSVAAASSPVGAYPITASITGGASANYAVMVTPGTLSVLRATLQVSSSPATRGVTYGAPIPAITGYSITGFLNGDSAGSSVTGTAGLQTTTATSTSPVGSYPITIAPGSLASANYQFQMIGGRFYIYKARLVGTIQNATIHKGDPIPAFNFNLSGFVNGDTPAVVTGAPILTTKATSASPAGKYAITGSLGTLSAQNYYFTPVNGVLTILP